MSAPAPPETIIETARLRLRPYRDPDRADLVALAGSWTVARWLAALPHPYTEADAVAWIAHVHRNHASGRATTFAVARLEDDRLIGGAGIDGSPGDASDEPALGYWLGEPYRGRGYGREAVAAVIRHGLGTLGHASIRACTDPGNARSQKLLLACGLHPAGEIELLHPMHSGATRAPLFRIEAG